MSGRLILRGKHRCTPPADQWGRQGFTRGDVWECECGRQWKVVDLGGLWPRPTWGRKWRKVAAS